MNSRWRRKKLGDVCQILSALVDPREPKFIDLPHIGAGNMISGTGELIDIKTAKEESLKSGKYTFDRSMVLYSKIRPYLMKVARPDFSGLCSADVYPLSPDTSQLDRDFLFYLLLSKEFTEYAIAGSSRAGMPKVNRDHLFNFTTRIPPLPEQKRIVTILDEAFEGIDGAIANTEKNLANARELFESYLNSLDAEKRSLGDLVDIRTGKLNANAAVEGGQYPFFTCSREIYQIDNYAFDCEAILLAGNNAVGDFNVKHYRGKFNAYQRTYVITVNQNKEVIYRYLYFQLLKSLKEFNAKSVGAGTRFLKLEMIKDLQISLPGLDEQEKIVSVLDELEEAVQELEAIYKQKLAALNELKQSILQKAFSGELTTDTAAQDSNVVQEVAAA